MRSWIQRDDQKAARAFPRAWKGHEREGPWDSGCTGITINMCVCQRETECVCVCTHGAGILPPELLRFGAPGTT